jgi:hypoxanthine-DNA glycosylase
MKEILQGLAPVMQADCHTLVLGSFPGVASLAAQQYYAHPRNQFWPIWSAILDEPLTTLAYAERLKRLLAHGVAVWDIYAACVRPGSADSAIENAQHNDFLLLKQQAQQLRRVGLNGATAGKLAPLLRDWGWQATQLPSTSAAYASRSFEQKLLVWREWWMT